MKAPKVIGDLVSAEAGGGGAAAPPAGGVCAAAVTVARVTRHAIPRDLMRPPKVKSESIVVTPDDERPVYPRPLVALNTGEILGRKRGRCPEEAQKKPERGGGQSSGV